MSRIGSLAVFLAAGVFAANGGAAVLLDVDNTATTQVPVSRPFTQGSEFTLTAPFTVRSLGFIDAEGDGLALSHEVAIWDTAGMLVTAIVTITPTSPTVVAGNGTSLWFMENLPVEVILAAGTYRIGAFFPDGDDNLADGIADSALVTRTAGYVRNDTGTATFGFPNLSFSANRTTATLSGDLVSNVPEPSSVLLTGLGALGLAYWRRRK